MKNTIVVLIFLFKCLAASAQETNFEEYKNPKSFENYLKAYFFNNYKKYFDKGCDINKAHVSFKINQNNSIADLKIISPTVYIEYFLKDALEAAQKDGLLDMGLFKVSKTVSFNAFFNFSVDCDKVRRKERNFSDQVPATNYGYRNGFKIIKEDDENIVLDKISFHGEIH